MVDWVCSCGLCDGRVEVVVLHEMCEGMLWVHVEEVGVGVADDGDGGGGCFGDDVVDGCLEVCCEVLCAWRAVEVDNCVCLAWFSGW